MPKLVLSQTYLYRGAHYGPGEVDVDAEAHQALTECEALVMPTSPDAVTETPDAVTETPASLPVKAAERPADKARG